MPTLFVLLIVFCIRSLTFSGRFRRPSVFIQPRLLADHPSVALGAMGQAFFTLSLGLGCMATYGSYFSSRTPLLRSAVTTASLDTLVAILSGNHHIPGRIHLRRFTCSRIHADIRSAPVDIPFAPSRSALVSSVFLPSDTGVAHIHHIHVGNSHSVFHRRARHEPTDGHNDQRHRGTRVRHTMRPQFRPRSTASGYSRSISSTRSTIYRPTYCSPQAD